MGVEKFQNQMLNSGYYIFPELISIPTIKKMQYDLEISYSYCRKIQIENGVDNSEGTCHHLIGQSESFMECLSQYEKIDRFLEKYFDGKYILNSFGGNILKKGMSYANDIHRDIRSFSVQLPVMLNTLVMIDDFTEDNGATWLMEGGHKWKDRPSEKEFNRHAFQLTGKSGTIAVWNSNLWHRAGNNITDCPRRSITPELTKPFMKQGFDYTQFVCDDMTEYSKQILGYYSRTPKSLYDWYKKPDERFYRSDQE